MICERFVRTMDDEEEELEAPPSQPLAFIPTVESFEKLYGRSLEGNDQKALRVFMDYETIEKRKRLLTELLWIKKGWVSEKVLDQFVGKRRKSRYTSYQHWAELMLKWMAATKK